MIVRYDSLNRLEIPKFTLCNPGSIYKDGLLTKVVGMITDHEAEEIVFNFNSTSELNMRVNRVFHDDIDEQTYVYNMCKSIQNRRLIFVENIGFFVITEVTDGYDDGIHYKDIRAQSADVELEQKMIPYIEDNTYRFLSDATGANKGLLETIVEILPLWTIGEVDSTVASRWRTFEDVDTSLNCLSFMLDDMQEAYECIFVFDCINRVINVYAQDNYIRQTNIHLTKNDLITSLNINENAEDIYTAISVLGDDDVTISAINPLGVNTMYNFDYYMDWMSEDLGAKVKTWQKDVSDAESDYYKNSRSYYEKLDEIMNLEMEQEKIATQITMYTRCRANIVAESGTSSVGEYNTVIKANGGKELDIGKEIADLLADIDTLVAECQAAYDENKIKIETAQAGAAEIEALLKKVQERLAIKSYFSEAELSELSNYIFEGSYSDSYVVLTDTMKNEQKFEQMKTLYDRAKNRLEKVSRPTQEFTVDAENFIFEKEFARWSEQLETGCLINVELDTDDIAVLLLLTITINYDDRTLSMTFGNRFNKFDTRSLFNDMLGNISKTANSLNYIKDILYPIKSGEFNYVKEALQTSRNLTMADALSSANEEVIIDGSGYTGRRVDAYGNIDGKQIKITGRNIVFTDDSWKSCRVAIGDIKLGENKSVYGINAEAIIGDVIVGNQLRILNSDGKDAFAVQDEVIQTAIGATSEVKQTADELSIRIQEIKDEGIDEITTTTGFTFGTYGLIIENSGSEMKTKIDETGMYISRSDEVVLSADNLGVNALNFQVNQFLIVGENCRFENYSNGTDANRTACFFISSSEE